MNGHASHNITSNGNDSNSHTEGFDSAAPQALNVMMSSSEQTYQQLLQSFSQLTAADVVTPLERELIGEFERNFPGISAATLSEVTASTTASEAADLADVKDKKYDGEELEEMTLDEGTISKGIIMTDSSLVKKVQVDNFVEDDASSLSSISDLDLDELDVNDILGSSPYQASFSTANDATANKQHNEEVETTEVATPTVSDTTHSNPETDLTEISSTQTHQSNAQNKFVSGHSNTQTLTPDNSDSSTVNYPVTDIISELKQIQEKQDQFSHTQLCSEYSSCLEADHSEDFDTLDLTCDNDEPLTYDSSIDIPNPGEIVEELTDHSKANMLKITNLACSCKLGDSENLLQTQPSEITQEEVSDFLLDINFDYDNVTLTPRYGADDMIVRMTAMLQHDENTNLDEHKADEQSRNEET